MMPAVTSLLAGLPSQRDPAFHFLRVDHRQVGLVQQLNMAPRPEPVLPESYHAIFKTSQPMMYLEYCETATPSQSSTERAHGPRAGVRLPFCKVQSA